MDRSVFEIARNETPEMRTKFLKEHLFKPGGAVPTAIPETPLRSESETDLETPREYGRRTIKGKLPVQKFPPARPRRIINTPENQARFEQFLMNTEAEAPPAPKPPKVRAVDLPAAPTIPERVIEVSPPEVAPVPDSVSIPVPVTVPDSLNPKESEDQMPKPKKNFRIMTTPKAKTEKGPKLSAVDKALGNLQSLEISGAELPSHNEYKAKFGEIPAHTFYGARNKFLKEEKQSAKAAPNGRGKPADVFVPAPAGVNGHARAHVEIIYSSDENPEAVVMKEVDKVVRNVLASFAQCNGIELAYEDLQIKVFAPNGWEIRRVVK